MWAALARFRNIDRRIIATLVLVLLSAPILWRVPLKIYPYKSTYTFKDYIDQLPRDKMVVIVADWDSGTKGECEPLTVAVMDYLMRENRKFAIFGFIMQGTDLAELEAEELARKHGKKYGVDWVNWGYKPLQVATLIGMMGDLPGTIKTDTKGTPLASVPVMQGFTKLTDAGLLYEVTGTGLLDLYLQFCAGMPLASGCTAVVGPENYPYLQSGQIQGLLVGLGGAAQFETATDFRDQEGNLGGKGLRGMGSQSLGHLLVMVLIVLGNLGAVAAQREQQRQAREAGGAES